jgi:hypothetical protein
VQREKSAQNYPNIAQIGASLKIIFAWRNYFSKFENLRQKVTNI